MTQTQFIVHMIVAYARRFPGIPAERAMRMAATTYRQFVFDTGVLFGDPAYAWDRDAAFILVHEYEFHS